MAIKVGRLEGCDWRVVDLGGSDWRVGGEGKKRSRSIFFGVFFTDALCRGWIEEWIGVGLRVGLGVY